MATWLTLSNTTLYSLLQLVLGGLMRPLRKRFRGLMFTTTKRPAHASCDMGDTHTDQVPETHLPQPPDYQLLDRVAEVDTMLEVIRFLPAADTARLSRCSKEFHMLAVDPLTSRWCAESRRDLLVSRAVAGDLPLAGTGDHTTTWLPVTRHSTM